MWNRIKVRHFKPRDFAQFHPGGELGKRLLTTAEDVMRSDDMPIIPKEMHLGEAIIHLEIKAFFVYCKVVKEKEYSSFLNR